MAKSVDISFEVLVLGNDRWEVKLVSANQGDALAASVELAKKPGVKGVRVVREMFEHKTGLSFGRIVFEQVKETRARAVRATSGG
ncbi:MAG: hypothetical protein KDH19_04250 [Geminicoccaceae bacterium]|nr:hypothetical protein [Geminicoccaceae bacterium]